MKKYVLKEGVRGMYSVNTTTYDVSILDYINSHIDWIYQADDNGELTLQNKDGEIIYEANVEKGDLIVKFYATEDYQQTPIIIVKDNDWKQNIINEKQAVITRAEASMQHEMTNMSEAPSTI